MNDMDKMKKKSSNMSKMARGETKNGGYNGLLRLER